MCCVMIPEIDACVRHPCAQFCSNAEPGQFTCTCEENFIATGVNNTMCKWQSWSLFVQPDFQATRPTDRRCSIHIRVASTVCCSAATSTSTCPQCDPTLTLKANCKRHSPTTTAPAYYTTRCSVNQTSRQQFSLLPMR